MGAPSKPSHTISSVRSRGYTLIELSIALVVVAIIASIGVGTYKTVYNQMNQQSAGPLISLVQMEARRLATNNSSYIYPADIVTPIVVSGVTLTVGDSSDAHTISVYRLSDSEAVFAAGSAQGCLVLVDRLNAAPTWVLDATKPTCKAEDVSGPASAVAGGTSANPRTVTL